MSTLKLKIRLDENSSKIIKDFRRQYTSCFNTCYNYIFEHPGISKHELEKSASDLNMHLRNCNNIELVLSNSWFKQCAIEEAFETYRSQKDKFHKICFGGKKYFKKRCNNKISKEEFKDIRLKALYSIGTAKPYKGNQKFRISQDCEGFIFQPNRNLRINLKIDGFYHNYKKILFRLYQFQEEKSLPLTYKLTNEYVWVYYDESKLHNCKMTSVENRVMSIDMNPNYVGWSIVDWSGSTENDFKVIKSGVISIKKLNDKDKEFKGKHLASNSKERTWLSSKRTHETLEISKKLVSIALHYRCQLFAVEELSMKASDKGLGKSFNKLVNNMWCRNALVNNLRKRCNIFGIKLLEVKPEYSSFIGNFLFRTLNLPDMVLASIEIGRRAFEFYNQYTTKKNKIQKNIVKPNLEDFNRFYSKSLEEFGMESSFKDLVELYYFFKNSKRLYRVSLESINILKHKVFREFSTKHSLICKIIYS